MTATISKFSIIPSTAKNQVQAPTPWVPPTKSPQGGLRTQGIIKKSQPGKPLISVVTVLRNNRTGLVDTLKSVFSQDYDNIELIVVDGGSNDGSLEFIQENSHCIDFWMSEKDSGFYNGLNKAIALAQGDYINVLNADDYYSSSSAVSIVVENILRGAVDIYGTDILMFNRQHGFAWVRKCELGKLALMTSGFPQQCFFVSRRALSVTGSFSETFKIVSDFDWLVRAIVTHKCTHAVIPSPLIVFCVGGASSDSQKVARERSQSLQKIYRPLPLFLFGGRIFEKIYAHNDLRLKRSRVLSWVLNFIERRL